MTQTRNIVELNNPRFRWRDNRPEVLDIPRLAVRQGEHLFIHGPSGSDKSSLISLLAGVNLPQAGSVSVLDREINRLSGPQRDRFRADHLGMMFQLFNLIPYLSLLDNVILPCNFSALRRTRALANSTSLNEEAGRLLGHLDLDDKALLHQPVTHLSVGQQQRAAAARALIGAPELLIADEPTSALDADRREAFLTLLFRECAQTGSTLIMVSHDHQLESLFKRQMALHEVNQIGETV
jgi:putative ABC transport system ATP-binding protein